MRMLILGPTSKTGHAKAVIPQTSLSKSSDHRTKLAAGKTDDPNAGVLERAFQGKADSTADQDICADVRQLLDATERPHACQIDALPGDFAVVCHVDQQEPFGDIEDR